MINFNDYKMENGGIDWRRVREAEVAAGENCYACRSMIVHGTGSRRLCNDCKELREFPDREVNHDSYVRCQHCGHCHDVSDWDSDYNTEKYEDGTHRVNCDECEKVFEFETNVSYSYTSREMEKPSAASSPVAPASE